VRRLVVLVCAMAAVETVFYSALAPLLPALRGQFGLSKGQVGLLVAMYAVGLCAAAVPVGLLASGAGVKRSALAGLLGLAATSVAFGLVDSYWQLLVARLLQGAAGALCWASGIAWLVEMAPRARRAEMIGLFSGASAAGAVLGPVVGGAAALIGRAGAFAAVAGFAVLVALASAGLPEPAGWNRQPVNLLRTVHGSRHLWGGQWLVGLPGLLLGTIGVLAPLRLHRLGFGPVGIAATYLVAAAIGVLARPSAGRWADRQNGTDAIRRLLLACAAATVAVPLVDNRWLLSVCVVLAVSSYGLLWGPTMASLSQAYEHAGVTQTFAFALMNLTVGIAIVVGSAAGGEIAHLAGDSTAYALTITACLATFTALALQRPTSPTPRTAD
jgi:predicted MFS family arabinose efflux permease